jgi:hypothetical protein
LNLFEPANPTYCNAHDVSNMGIHNVTATGHMPASNAANTIKAPPAQNHGIPQPHVYFAEALTQPTIKVASIIIVYSKATILTEYITSTEPLSACRKESLPKLQSTHPNHNSNNNSHNVTTQA